MQDAVDVTRAQVGEDGRTEFEDCSQPYGRDSSPFNITERLTAEAIRFGWVSAGFTSAPENDTPDRLIVVLEGSLDVALASGARRQFGLGDLLLMTAAGAGGAVRRAPGSGPVHWAELRLSNPAPATADGPVPAGDPAGAPFLRTWTGEDGRSRTKSDLLPYGQVAGECLTAEIPLVGFQYVLAPASLNYDWHRAPQRQFVLFITGGAEIENGLGERHTVLPGGIYLGEDETGQGHITRALEGRERFSIFAHLG
ncbi:MAG: hypothetical protein QF546_01330 [Alphaproteobacteria bacterium]|jgi:hypothetical protein|nr:hypothetical protein [Alphaproteobacteria bacterium]HJP21073.1 hypothetical protein [Alphaproteobacteria bacterium]